jgi:hypothetical protein
MRSSFGGSTHMKATDGGGWRAPWTKAQVVNPALCAAGAAQRPGRLHGHHSHRGGQGAEGQHRLRAVQAHQHQPVPVRQQVPHGGALGAAGVGLQVSLASSTGAAPADDVAVPPGRLCGCSTSNSKECDRPVGQSSQISLPVTCRYGFVVMDGNGSLFGTVSGNTREVRWRATYQTWTVRTCCQTASPFLMLGLCFCRSNRRLLPPERCRCLASFP